MHTYTIQWPLFFLLFLRNDEKKLFNNTDKVSTSVNHIFFSFIHKSIMSKAIALGHHLRKKSNNNQNLLHNVLLMLYPVFISIFSFFLSLAKKMKERKKEIIIIIVQNGKRRKFLAFDHLVWSGLPGTFFSFSFQCYNHSHTQTSFVRFGSFRKYWSFFFLCNNNNERLSSSSS